MSDELAFAETERTQTAADAPVSTEASTELLIALVGHFAETEDLREALRSSFELREFRGAAALVNYLTARPDTLVPALVINDDEVNAASVLAEVHDTLRLADAPTVVLTSAARCVGLGPAVDRGQLQAVTRLPISGSELRGLIGSVSRPWMLAHGFQPFHPQPDAPSLVAVSDLLEDFSADEDELTDQLVTKVDQSVGPLPRLVLDPGVRLTRQGRESESIFVLLTGRVALTRRSPSGDNLLLHHRSTGRLIGLLSLVGSDNSYFTATTTARSEVVLLSLEQLRVALKSDPHVLAALAVIGLRGLSLRLVRSEELQIERNELNNRLEREQKRLRMALQKLRKARAELVSQAKFATLGEMSAGIAHELNNPVAALVAAAEHIAEDLEAVLSTHPAYELLERASVSDGSPQPSAAEQRAVRREIEAQIGDPALAFRLAAAGITDPELVGRIDEDDLAVIEAAAQLQTASRNIRTASGRIQGLVKSLRSYSRPENDQPQQTDVRETVDDTLALLSHRMRDIAVTREYADVPMISAQPSQLGQVWTNLLANAAEAMGDVGHLHVRISAPEPDWVQVEVMDDGPGVPPENFDKIFDPRFTTKSDTVRYGLGLGLSLTRQLVHRHGGAISVDSVPGRTVFTVGLPVGGLEQTPTRPVAAAGAGPSRLANETGGVGKANADRVVETGAGDSGGAPVTGGLVVADGPGPAGSAVDADPGGATAKASPDPAGLAAEASPGDAASAESTAPAEEANSADSDDGGPTGPGVTGPADVAGPGGAADPAGPPGAVDAESTGSAASTRRKVARRFWTRLRKAGR